jgi:hypothetical protein
MSACQGLASHSFVFFTAQGLRQYATDPALQQAWRTVKQQAKQRAAAKIHALTGVKVSPNALFDIQVRRGCWWLLASAVLLQSCCEDQLVHCLPPSLQ